MKKATTPATPSPTPDVVDLSPLENERESLWDQELAKVSVSDEKNPTQESAELNAADEEDEEAPFSIDEQGVPDQAAYADQDNPSGAQSGRGALRQEGEGNRQEAQADALARITPTELGNKSGSRRKTS